MSDSPSEFAAPIPGTKWNDGAEKSQAAELRVALELDGEHALIAQANLKGGDIYCGTPPRPVKGKKREIVRTLFMPAGRRDFTDSGSRL